MSLGLCNAHGIFQRTMDVVLSRVEWQFILVIYDNFADFTKTLPEIAEDVQKFSSFLQSAGNILKLRTFKYSTVCVDNLDHFIFSRRI